MKVDADVVLGSGVYRARGHAPYGWDRNASHGLIEQNATEQAVLRIMIDMFNEGKGYAEIAAQLNAADFRAKQGGAWSARGVMMMMVFHRLGCRTDAEELAARIPKAEPIAPAATPLVTMRSGSPLSEEAAQRFGELRGKAPQVVEAVQPVVNEPPATIAPPRPIPVIALNLELVLPDGTKHHLLTLQLTPQVGG